MTSTLDNICANIDARFESLAEILNIYDKYELDKDDVDLLNSAVRALNNIKSTYRAETLEILTNFYNTDADGVKKKAHTQFIKVFHSSNIIGELHRIYSICQRFRKIYKLDEPGLSELIKTYERSVVDETFASTKSNICPICDIPYTIEEKTAEYLCTECGRLEKMYGVVFEDDQFFYQEGQRTKHGKYDPVKHAKAWLDRIQAKEMTEIPVSIINAIKTCIKRDCLWVDSITCDNIRGYLKQLKKTSYNNHVPLIRRLATNIEPDQLTEHESQLVYMYIGIVIQVYTIIKNDPNCPYLPFFIYKIIEQILKKPKNATRRKNILSCIHLQSRVTLVENDRLWFMICDYIPEFSKLPTNGGKR